MLTAQPSPSMTVAASWSDVEPAWLTLARMKKAEQARLIPAEWSMPESYLAQFQLSDDQSAILLGSGLLSDEEIRVTSIEEPLQLQRELLDRSLTAAGLVGAYAKRAALAHQLVSSALHCPLNLTNHNDYRRPIA